jgi:hypothetical protein
MAKYSIKPGTTDVTVYVHIVDSTTAAGETGLAYNTSGLSAYYVRTLGSATAITLATQTVGGAHSDGGFVEVDATNMPGVYRLDLPDAVCATSARAAEIMVKGTGILAGFVTVDLNSEVNTTHLAGTAQTGRDIGTSVLLSSGTGTGQVSLSSGRVNGDVVYWNGSAIAGVDTAGYPKVTIKDGTGTGELDTASGKVSIATGGIVAASFGAGAIDAAATAADFITEITAAVKALVIETEGSITVGQALSVILAAASGVTASGGAVLKDPSGTATRITATINGSNERTAMTLTPSA